MSEHVEAWRWDLGLDNVFLVKDTIYHLDLLELSSVDGITR